jgi:hypothetical protein
MSWQRCALVLISIAAVLAPTIQARSIPDDDLRETFVAPSTDDQRRLAHAFTGYRHRFEQSPHFRTLRWSLENVQIAGLCELCELGAPLVRLLLDLNQTALIDEAISIFCQEYKSLDENVCLGAAHEYLVEATLFRFAQDLRSLSSTPSFK